MPRSAAFFFSQSHCRALASAKDNPSPSGTFHRKIDRPDKEVWKEWYMATIKNLSISILEFVLSQPAHKLPAVFDLEQSPVPHGEISLEDVLEEIVRMQSAGLIEANVLQGSDGKPCKAQIRYVTLGGKNYLQGSDPLAARWSFIKKILVVVVAAVVLFGFLLFGGFGRKNQVVATAPTPTPIPTPEATATPIATPTQEITPLPSATPSPTPEATPLPTATPSPTPSPSTSPKPKPKPRETPRATPSSKPAPSTSPKPKPRETPRVSPQPKSTPSVALKPKEKPRATPGSKPAPSTSPKPKPRETPRAPLEVQ